MPVICGGEWLTCGGVSHGGVPVICGGESLTCDAWLSCDVPATCGVSLSSYDAWFFDVLEPCGDALFFVLMLFFEPLYLHFLFLKTYDVELFYRAFPMGLR